MKCHIALFSMCLLSIGAAGPVAAQSDDAKAAFEEGKRLFAQKKYADAADQFRAAYEFRESWKLLYNIGQAEAAATRYGLAMEAFEQYLAEAGDEIDEERRNEVLEEIVRLRNMVGELSVTGPEGATVKVDGMKRGTLPMAGTIAVSAGVAHRVVVELDRAVLLDQEVRIRSGKEQRLEAKAPIPTDDAIPSIVAGTDTTTEQESPPDEVPGRAMRAWGIALSSAGGALLVGGIVTGSLALSRQKKLDDRCVDGVCYGGDTQSIEDGRDHLALATDILLPLGGAVAATGLVLLIVHAARRSESAVSVQPLVHRNGAGFVVGRRFSL